MIIEVRTYTTKPGRRADFITLFETQAMPALRAHGMKIFGPMLDLERPDVFVFLRGFPSLEAREEMKAAFYEGPFWKEKLEGIAMPMLEKYEVMLVEPSPGMVTFDPTNP